MAKIILVQPKNELNETTYIPLGLISLAAFIRGKFGVKIVDLRLQPLNFLYDQIRASKPLAVGFSMLTGSCIKQTIEAAREIKRRNPKIKIIVGGIHPTFFPEQTLVNPYIDFVIINEGERALLDLLEALKSGSSLAEIDGLGWKDKKKKLHINGWTERFLPMDDLPRPAWNLIDVEKYVNRLSSGLDEWVAPGEPRLSRVVNMYTSKGCPFPCSFCYNLNFNKRQWRAKSAEKAVAEMEMLYEKYRINYFIIHDDNFVVDRKRALRIAELIKEKGMKIKYSIDARIDYFDRDFLQKMKDSGLCEIRVGCESGSNRILTEIIQKRITKEQTVKAVKVARDLNLKLILSFVIGWPTETIAERQETIDLVLELQRIHPKAAVYPLWVYIPYPGTALFNQAVKLGFEQPTTLEGWGNYFWGKAHIPWLKNPREYEIIHELSPFAWYSKTWNRLSHKTLKNILKFVFVKLFRPLILFRFKYNFWKLPIDAEAIIWIKRFLKKRAT
ncbi:MAG: radical SAM protein [Patescibacteria group bacterium]|nr:radical SAM protein [Patescibacteria group bacterium]